MLFGHSMGVLIVGEILKNVLQFNYPRPLRVFFSGRNPLHYQCEGPYLFDEDGSVFKENLLSCLLYTSLVLCYYTTALL